MTKELEANNIEEADICPFAFKIKSRLPSTSEWICDEEITKPPIRPLDASIEPLNVTSPLGSKWKWLELISICPPDALINWLLEPTKNYLVLISNTDGFDLNLNKLSLSPTSSKPTPW